MIKPVEKQFEKIEEQRKKLLTGLEELSHEQLNFKPDSDSWSILQVLTHLMMAESNGLKYLQKKILGINKMKKAGAMAKIRSALLNNFLRLPIKYKAPDAALPEFQDVYIFANIVQEWDKLREEFKKFLDQLDHKNAEKPIFKHPVVGRLNIYQALSFIEEHVDHHTKQIQRIKAHPGFPANGQSEKAETVKEQS